MPKWTFSPQITFGNLLSMATMVLGLVAGYVTLAGSVSTSAEAVKAIPGIERRVSTIETRIDIGQRAREQFQDEMKAQLADLQRQNTLILQAIARLETKVAQ